MCKKKKYYIAVMVSLTIALMTTGWAEQIQAQEKYPNKPIQIIVSVAAGGSNDSSARIMADYLKNGN